MKIINKLRTLFNILFYYHQIDLIYIKDLQLIELLNYHKYF